jgi:hypothetical protein
MSAYLVLELSSRRDENHDIKFDSKRVRERVRGCSDILQDHERQLQAAALASIFLSQIATGAHRFAGSNNFMLCTVPDAALPRSNTMITDQTRYTLIMLWRTT